MTDEPTKTRLELLVERFNAMPSGPLKSRVGDEMLRAGGVFAIVDARRAEAIEENRSAVREAVARQRRLTHATGVPESPVSIRPGSQSRMVHDPMMTDAEFLHRQHLELERANAIRTKPDLNVGKVRAEENAMTRIGGLALVRRRLGHHERAAEWFKSAYEALYGGVAPAIDASRVRVDTSIMAHDSGMVARIDRAADLQGAIAALGQTAADRIVATVVLCIPCADVAVPGPSGKPSGHAIELAVNLLLNALDHLAELRGMKTRGPLDAGNEHPHKASTGALRR